MNTVRRAMTNYAPKHIVISADKAKSAHTAAKVATSTASPAEQSAAAPEPAMPPVHAASNQEPDPQPMPDPVPAPKTDGQLDGVRGLLHLRCEDCGKPLATFLKFKQQKITCRCGYSIDLTKPLARFHYTCPYCGMERWGWTNLEDPTISVKCKCVGMVDMQWEPKTKEYRN